MALRRDVYLPAAESVSKLQTLLARTIDPASDSEEVSRELGQHIAALNKVFVIGSASTLHALTALMAEVTPVYADLSFRRLLMVQRQTEIKSLEDISNPEPTVEAKLNDLRIQHAREQLSLMRVAVDKLLKLAPLSIPVLTSVRKEMELESEELAIREAFEQSSNAQRQTLENFIKDLTSVIEQYTEKQ